jgi:hypothetical protein
LKIEGSNKLRVSPEILLYGIEDFHDRLSILPTVAPTLSYRISNLPLQFLLFHVQAISIQNQSFSNMLHQEANLNYNYIGSNSNNISYFLIIIDVY